MSFKDTVVPRIIRICDGSDIKVNELAPLSNVTPSTAYSMFYPCGKYLSLITIL